MILYWLNLKDYSVILKKNKKTHTTKKTSSQKTDTESIIYTAQDFFNEYTSFIKYL